MACGLLAMLVCILELGSSKGNIFRSAGMAALTFCEVGWLWVP